MIKGFQGFAVLRRDADMRFLVQKSRFSGTFVLYDYDTTNFRGAMGLFWSMGLFFAFVMVIHVLIETGLIKEP